MSSGPRPRHALLPSREMLRKATVLALVSLVPALAALAISGLAGFVLVFLSTLLSAGALLALDRRTAVAFVATVVVLAALAAVVRGNQPVVLGVLVSGAAVATGAASHRSSRVVGVAPVVVLMAALLPTGMTSVATAGWVAAGAVYALVVAIAVGLRAPARPIPVRAAIVYTVVLAASCGVTASVVTALDLPRAYWLVITLAVLLKPSSGDTTGATRDRIVGTLAGGALALAVSLVLPASFTVVLAVIATALCFAYMLSGQMVRQIAALTVMVVLLTSVAAGTTVAEADAYRVGWTLVGAAFAVCLAVAVEHLTPRAWSVVQPATAPVVAGERPAGS